MRQDGPATSFAQILLQWHEQHGRTGLPWQNTGDPYRVWLSEIMLQQTQVSTVKAYYHAFLQQFPTVVQLADASPDKVMALWAGLGYYSRARNLHACAKAVVQQHGGQFPRTAAMLQTLPGIGPSTAAAIASFCFEERVAIFDGNVQRVMARVFGFDQDITQMKNRKLLQKLADDCLPSEAQSSSMPRYTQAIMDLGATVCAPKQPACQNCPMALRCAAKASGEPTKFPFKSKKLKRSSESLWLLWAKRAGGQVLLQKRPVPGVWAGLYCLPSFDSEQALSQALPSVARDRLQAMPAFVHVLTHKDLHLHVMVLSQAPVSLEPVWGDWMSHSDELGMPAPIKKLLRH